MTLSGSFSTINTQLTKSCSFFFVRVDTLSSECTTYASYNHTWMCSYLHNLTGLWCTHFYAIHSFQNSTHDFQFQPYHLHLYLSYLIYYAHQGNMKDLRALWSYHDVQALWSVLYLSLLLNGKKTVKSTYPTSTNVKQRETFTSCWPRSSSSSRHL